MSFSDQKKARVENAMNILDKRYPTYHGEIHQHIQANPAHAIRQKIQLDMLLQNGKQKLLYVTHHMGGGIQTHIEEMQEFFKEQRDILLLRPSTLDGKDVELSYKGNNFDFSLHFSLTSEWPVLLTVLRSLAFDRVHFHHLMRVPEKVWTIAQVLNLEYDVTLHDYYMVNGNPTLTDGNGIFVEKLEDREVKCAEHYAIPLGLTLNQWHQKMKNFLMGASRVFSPSQACANIYQLYFSELNITVAFHVDSEAIQQYPSVKIPKITEKEKIRVAVIGAVSREKGADIFEHTACHKDPLDRLEFHLIGYAYKPLRETVTQHGSYKNEDLQNIIKNVAPHIIWFPAQWPETYCYVLSSAMQAGLPVLASNLGSFPERLEGRPASFVQPWNQTPEQWKNILIQIREWMIANSGKTLEWHNSAFCKTTYRYPKNYFPSKDNAEKQPVVAIELDKINALCARQAHDKVKERILRALWLIREMPVMRTVQRLVPFDVQRKVKRVLSPRPIHDILHQDK